MNGISIIFKMLYILRLYEICFLRSKVVKLIYIIILNLLKEIFTKEIKDFELS